jgi:hypothetical protein
MARIRKKISKSTLILLVILAVAAIALIICHFVGVIDLSFVGDYAMMLSAWMSESGINTGIGFGVTFGIGFGLCYLLKDYIIGMDTANAQMTVNTNQGYAPQPTVPTQSPNNSNTVV